METGQSITELGCSAYNEATHHNETSFTHPYLHMVALCQRINDILPKTPPVRLEAETELLLSREGESYIASVVSGSISLDVRIAGGGKWRNLALVSSPLIVGQNQIMHWSDNKLMRISGYNGGAQVRLYPVSVVEALLTEYQEWETMSRLLALSDSYTLYMHGLTLSGNAYCIVRGMLEHMKSDDFCMFRQVNATVFISQRTGLSRSSVANILSRLHHGNFIHIESGKVESIGQLPETLNEK